MQDFDPRSGSPIERALFNHRWLVLLLGALVTLALGWQATNLIRPVRGTREWDSVLRLTISFRRTTRR